MPPNSKIILADSLNLGEIVSVDVQDFNALRWANGKKPFVNLMNFFP